MQFDSIRVVLVETSHPGNIGATARAMKTMGLTRLYLVSPRCFPDRQAHEMAAGADDVLQHAQVTDSLAEALAGCQLVLATSARPRDLPLPGLSPAHAASLIVTESVHHEVALVFGREHSGLTNQELLHCHYHVHIPGDAAFSSLNLAQAVQIVAYEIRMRALSPEPHTQNRCQPRATADDMERFYQHLQRVLLAIDFLKPNNPGRVESRLRRLFNRSQVEAVELRLLRGILTEVERSLCRARADTSS